VSRLFAPLRQMRYVVPDIEASMRHWVEVCGGVAPLFYAERLVLTSGLSSRAQIIRRQLMRT
jgi:hypothetical protein